MTKKQKVLSVQKVAVSSAVAQVASIQAKFKELAAVQTQIARLKFLYQEQDRLMTELLPLFITKTGSQFIIEREITIGNETHKMSPRFWDEKKGILLNKQWKSTAVETGTIE